MPDDHFLNIYRNHADRYDAMVQREDYEGNLLPAIEGVVSLDGIHVIEMGAGTGRLTRLLAPHVKTITACDFSPAMLSIARPSLLETAFAVANNRDMPFTTNCADLVLSGWSLGHLQHWYQDGWQKMVDGVLSEMTRLARPGGTILIIETLGTGLEMPSPPNEGLAAYYEHLEETHGFERRWIRTDYEFASLDEAVDMMRFFFGDEMAAQTKHNHWIIVPECTGLWSLRV